MRATHLADRTSPSSGAGRLRRSLEPPKARLLFPLTRSPPRVQTVTERDTDRHGASGVQRLASWVFLALS